MSESSVDVQLLSRRSLSQGLGLRPIPLWITPPQVRGSAEVRQVPSGLAASALRLGSPPFTWGPAQRKGKVDKALYWTLCDRPSAVYSPCTHKLHQPSQKTFEVETIVLTLQRKKGRHKEMNEANECIN